MEENNMYTPQKANILVVDDTHANLRLLTDMLTRYGYIVRPVPDGSMALLSAQKAPPDLILLDIMMPKISGYEICEQLKADDRTRDIPVLFISALNEVLDKVKAFSVGGVDYITKPFQPEEVVARVETHLTLRNLQKRLQKKNVQLQQENTERKRAEEALKESIVQIEQAKQEWEFTADSLSYVVCLLDNQGYIIRVNRTVQFWNLGRIEDIKGKNMHELFHPECADPDCYLETFLTYAWEEVAQGVSISCDHKDNILQRYLDVQVRPISAQTKRKRQSSDSFAVGIVSDITARKWAEETLKYRNHELTLLNEMSEALQKCHVEQETYPVVVNVCQQLFPSSSGQFAMLNPSGPLLEVVDSWGSPFPSSPTFGVGECWALRHGRIHVPEQSNTEAHCPHLHRFPPHGYLCAPVRMAEEPLGVLSLAFGPPETYLDDETGRRMLESKWMVITRVIEHYALALTNLRLRETLRLESIHDPLTGLYNRRHMEASLERETHRAKRNQTPVGILMLDIDHFKTFNDTHGHEAGDVVLQHLGILLQHSIRGGDIACRYGGEEFLLILPEATPSITEQRARDLLKQVSLCEIPYQGTNFRITVSIGVATFSDHGTDVQEVINTADKALYQAKEQGRNRIVVASLPFE